MTIAPQLVRADQSAGDRPQIDPRGPRFTATVTSDTDCDPDAQGLSHCHNGLKLADGTQITVIDSHNMNRFRCLGEGDQLTLKAVGTSWIVATLTKK